MKGEVKKLKSKPLTIDNKFAKDGLEAVSILEGKEPYYIVGGVATQSYLPTSCRRPTSDIDLSLVRPLNYEDFKAISKPIEEFLLDNNYEVQKGKRCRAFCLEVKNKEEDTLLIEFARRNDKCFERSKKKLERELANSKRKIIEQRASTYSVVATEDIIIPKLCRSINALKRNPSFKEYLPDEHINLSDEYIKKRLDFINNLREQSMQDPCNLELFGELKIVSDIFDVRILSEIAGININYFNEVSKDWSVISEDTFERNRLFRFVLPALNH